jgi:hypothetical protein
MDNKLTQSGYDRLIEDMKADRLIEELKEQEERSLRLTCLKLALEYIEADENGEYYAEDAIEVAKEFESYILNK